MLCETKVLSAEEEAKMQPKTIPSIFIHIPRTSGVYLSTILTDFYPIKDIFSLGTIPRQNISAYPKQHAIYNYLYPLSRAQAKGTTDIEPNPTIKITEETQIDKNFFISYDHCDLRLLLSYKLISQDKWDGAYKFTIVRNPWSRLRSLWGHLKNNTWSGASLTRWATLGEFINGPMLGTIVEKDLHIHQIGWYNYYNFSMFNPCSAWVLDDINFVGKYETLDITYKTIADKLNIPQDSLEVFSDGNLNSSRDEGTEEIKNLSPQQEEIVRTFYEDDFKTFDYPLENPYNTKK